MTDSFTFSTPEEKNALEVLASAVTVSAWKKHIHGLELVSGPHRPQETRLQFLYVLKAGAENKLLLANSINDLHEARSEPL